MPIHLKAFRKWIRQVYATQDEELGCDELFVVLPRYVDLEVAGGSPGQHFPEVEHHLGQCAECYDLYLTLRDVAHLESQEVVSELVGVQRS